MCSRYFWTKAKRYKTIGDCKTMLGCGRQCKTDIGQQFGGFGMLLVSEDLSSVTVWTILYYTRYVGKLSTRSLSYLCPDLPNTTTVVVSGCRPLARGLRSNVIKLRYLSIQARLHIHTHLHSSEHRSVLCVSIHQRFQPDTLSLVPYDRGCIIVT